MENSGKELKYRVDFLSCTHFHFNYVLFKNITSFFFSPFLFSKK